MKISLLLFAILYGAPVTIMGKPGGYLDKNCTTCAPACNTNAGFIHQ